MAKQAVTSHSEFRARYLLKVKAPVGDSPRAEALRNLVAEMTERYATGHLTEWMIEAMLERMMRDRMARDLQDGAPTRYSDAYQQRGNERQLQAADDQQGNGVVAKVSDDAFAVDGLESIQSDLPMKPKPVMGAGLRVMG